MASVHYATVTQNFIALENHSVDVAWWNDLVTGVGKPIIKDGYIKVPDGPGLGIELNEAAVKAHLDPDDPGYFKATGECDRERSWDRLWS